MKLSNEQIAHDITIASLPMVFEVMNSKHSKIFEPYTAYKKLYEEVLKEVEKDNSQN